MGLNILVGEYTSINEGTENEPHWVHDVVNVLKNGQVVTREEVEQNNLYAEIANTFHVQYSWAANLDGQDLRIMNQWKEEKIINLTEKKLLDLLFCKDPFFKDELFPSIQWAINNCDRPVLIIS